MLGCEEKRTFVYWFWECKLVQPPWKTLEVPQNIKNRTTIGSSNPIWGYLSTVNENTNLKRYMHPHGHCSLFTIAKIWKQFKCPLMDKQIKKSCTHTWVTPSDPMDCSLPGSSVHGICQARVLEWVAIAFSTMAYSVQFSLVAQSCLTLCDPMNRSTPGLPVHHQLPEFTQTHVHRVSDAIQPSHPLSSPSPPAPNPSQHQSLFQWVNSSHEVAKVLEFQL